MRWPWSKETVTAPEPQDAAPRRIEMPQGEPPEAPEVNLADLSLTDMEAWLASPFWRVLASWLGEEIELNKQALLRGDAALSMRGEEGLCYRNDDTLRGGIIGMEFTRTLFPTQLRQEIEAAIAERRAAGQEGGKQ